MSLNAIIQRVVTVQLVLGAIVGIPFRDAHAKCERPRTQAGVVTGAEGAAGKCGRPEGAEFEFSMRRLPPQFRLPSGAAWSDLDADLPQARADSLAFSFARGESLAFRLRTREPQAANPTALPFDWVGRRTLSAAPSSETKRSFARPDFSARMKLLQANEQRLSIDWGKSGQGIEKGLTLSFDEPSASLERLSLQAKIVRAEDGSRRYVVGLQSEHLEIKHHSRFSVAVGETGTGGLGATASWSRDFFDADGGIAAAVAAGDEGVSAILRFQRRF